MSIYSFAPFFTYFWYLIKKYKPWDVERGSIPHYEKIENELKF